MMQCRSCNASELESIIPLGTLPLANALIQGACFQNEAFYNLEVMLCPTCGLAQLRDLVDPETLFSHYVYFSSHSETMLASAKALVERLIPTLPSEAFVLEIASNDGYLLKNYLQKNIPVLGIDPAQNIAKIANEQGIPTLCAFFGEALASDLAQEGKHADIIHANNVMAHVPDINGFLAGLRILLKPTGYAVIEVPYILDLVSKLEFDTIYHEHVYYFAIQPLKIAFERHGLALFNIEKLAIHGGTLRLFVGHAEKHVVKPVVSEMMRVEQDSGVLSPDRYGQFRKQITELRSALLEMLQTLKTEKKAIAAYGASAKGATLLNFFGIGAEELKFVVDLSPAKQGLYTPGTHLEIRSPAALLEEKIDYALLLTWNFAEEIMRQQSAFRAQGGKFILPLPEVKIVS